MIYLAKDISKMRQIIIEGIAKELKKKHGASVFPEHDWTNDVSPARVEDLLRTYITAGISLEDLQRTGL